MVLGQIETEVDLLSAHLKTESPNLEFILVHARAILQLAEGLIRTPSNYLDTDRDAKVVSDYEEHHRPRP